MKFGLSDRTIKELRNFFKKFPEIEEVKIYGSRAMDNYEEGSDIDFAIYGDINHDLLAKIIYEIDELPTPYKYDITDYNTLGHKNLKEHIDRVGKTFYKKEQ